MTIDEMVKQVSEKQGDLRKMRRIHFSDLDIKLQDVITTLETYLTEGLEDQKQAAYGMFEKIKKFYQIYPPSFMRDPDDNMIVYGIQALLPAFEQTMEAIFKYRVKDYFERLKSIGSAMETLWMLHNIKIHALAIDISQYPAEVFRLTELENDHRQ